jgi:hypothetical protein
MAAGKKSPLEAGARACVRCVVTLAVWTTWLLLLVLLLFQAYIGAVSELRVPRFLLHAIEDHLAQSGISVKFGRATFDPSGRILLQKARVSLSSFSEPIVTADAIYVRLDPIALLERRFEAREIRATGANLFIPAMLSASGRAEKIVQDLDGGFSITSRGDEFSVDYLNCRLGGIFVSARGTVNAGPVARNATTATPLPLAEFLSFNYVALSKEFSRAEEQLAGLGHASLTAVLTPSDTRGAIVNAELYADALRLEKPQLIDAEGVHALCRFPLLGGAPLMTTASVAADKLKVCDSVEASSVRAWVRGVLKSDTLDFDPKEIVLTAGSVTAMGIVAEAPRARLTPRGGRAFGAELAARFFGLPLEAKGSIDLAANTADLSFDGSISPAFTAPLSTWTGANIRKYADMTQPVAATGSIRFLPGWKLGDVRGRVDTRKFTCYQVAFDEARGFVTYDGTHLVASNAVVRSGDNLALGSYEQDFSTLAFRYLLTGRLQPLYISPWFGGDRWTGIFGNFAFPVSLPDASIDVQGRYTRGASFFVYGYADAKQPVIRGVALDSARVLLSVDPSATNGYHVFVSRGEGTAEGSFKLSTDASKGGLWSGLDIDARSGVDPGPVGSLLPAEAAAAISAFSFDKLPSVDVRGHFDGPAAGTAHKTLHAEVRSDSPLKAHGVAFDRLFFKLDLDDDTIDVRDVSGGFAGGEITGTGHLSGPDSDRRLRFKATLASASLGQAAAAAEGYVMTAKPGNSTALDTFAKDKSGVRLDLNAAAEGRMGDISTFVGDGSVQVQGSNLGELSLLGGLSKVLKFPELRFTQARSSFKIAKGGLEFPDLSVLGANSQIKAKGTYSIDRRMLDFSATIYPFMESKSILQLFNAISAPLSAIFRVRLTGSIDKPSWGLAYSPLNLLRVGEAKPGAADKGAPASLLAEPQQ